MKVLKPHAHTYTIFNGHLTVVGWAQSKSWEATSGNGQRSLKCSPLQPQHCGVHPANTLGSNIMDQPLTKTKAYSWFRKAVHRLKLHSSRQQAITECNSKLRFFKAQHGWITDDHLLDNWHLQRTVTSPSSATVQQTSTSRLTPTVPIKELSLILRAHRNDHGPRSTQVSWLTCLQLGFPEEGEEWVPERF